MRRTERGHRSFDVEVDAAGLYCPIPILRLERAFRDRPKGVVARLQATDPASVEDVQVFCREGGHRLLETRRDAERFYFLVEKGS